MIFSRPSRSLSRRHPAAEFYRQALTNDGYFLTSPGLDPTGADSLLKSLGSFLPQYCGELEYKVAYAPGFDGHLYSKSLNEIGPHTEAPILDPPPRYLALYCHTQARCGGGQTQLADGFEFLETLAPSARRAVETEPVVFAASPRPDREVSIQAGFPLVSRDAQGSPILRFSHNLFYYGDVNARIDDRSDHHYSYLSAHLQDVIVSGVEFFRLKNLSILIGEAQMLVWDNHRMLHARTAFTDPRRHLSRYWLMP